MPLFPWWRPAREPLKRTGLQELQGKPVRWVAGRRSPCTYIGKELSSGFAYVIGRSYNNNTLRINKLPVNHWNLLDRLKDKKGDQGDGRMAGVLEHCPITGEK